MKRIIWIIMFIICITLAYASIENLGTFSRGECVSLKQLCATCTYNNITSVMSPAPNTLTLLSMASMDKSGTEYNYTFCNTTPIGTYTVNGVGDLSGTDTVWNYNFEITDTGKPYLTVSGTESMSVTLFIILLTIALFLIGIKVKLSGNPVANIIFKRLFIMGGLYLLSLDAAIIVTIAGSVGLGLEQELFLLLWLINMVIYIFMIFIVITTIFNVLKMINKMAKLKRMGNYGNENEYY